MTRPGSATSFCHGLGGDPGAYWCHGGKDENSWPRWLGQDLPRVGVWSYGYDAAWTGWLGSTMALPQRAQECLERLTLAMIGTRPVVFIVHSLGGLVVKYVLFRLLRSPEPAKQDWPTAHAGSVS